jgi:1-acyl-sn-glycerol-3-phosphate acyltransferase
VHWLGKVQLFRFPFGGVMRWLGGVPVDRSRANNLVEAAVECFRAAGEPFFLVVPPEGTRSKVREWKTGFYYIAHGAGVPIVMAYMDHGCREASVAALFQPSGDIESDMKRIRAFYAPFKGRNPDGAGRSPSA